MRVGLEGVYESESVFAADGSKPLCQLMGPVEVRAYPRMQSEAIFRPEKGDLVEIHKLWKRKGQWVEIKMVNGAMGYMPAATNLRLLDRVKLEAEVELFDQPSGDATPCGRLAGGTALWLFANGGDDQARVPVRLDSGREGYIPASAKIVGVEQPTIPAVESASRDIVVGALWCIGGIAVSAGTYFSASEKGGSYVVAWGAVVFGGIQFLRGLYSAFVAERPPYYGQQSGV